MNTEYRCVDCDAKLWTLTHAREHTEETSHWSLVAVPKQSATIVWMRAAVLVLATWLSGLLEIL